jgi:hypothetical protein
MGKVEMRVDVRGFTLFEDGELVEHPSKLEHPEPIWRTELELHQAIEGAKAHMKLLVFSASYAGRAQRRQLEYSIEQVEKLRLWMRIAERLE